MRTRKLNIDENGMNPSWFNSKGKIVIKEAQNYNFENLEVTQDYSIEVNAEGEGRRIIISYKSNNPFNISFDTQQFEEMKAGVNKIYFVLQEGDNINEILISKITNDVYFDYLNIKITELSTKIEVKNFEENEDAVINSLYQKLYTLKRELWYSVNFGMPLLEKNKSKVNIDSFILQTLSQQEGVRNILVFNSKVENGEYKCNMELDTIYGDVNLSI